MIKAIEAIRLRLLSQAPLDLAEKWALLGLLDPLDLWVQREAADLLGRKESLDPWERKALQDLRDHEVQVAKRAIKGRRGLPDPQGIFPQKPKP